MSLVRPAAPGKTRSCPHCKATILESASVCPACNGHLRFDPAAAQRKAATVSALRVEGSFRHPAREEPWEYTILITVRNDRGEEVTRHVVGVGALQPGEKRTFTLSVELQPPPGSKALKPDPRASTLPDPRTIRQDPGFLKRR